MAASKLSIYSALAANLLIAITKFVAGGFTRSASMIAEGVHSLVDTTNQLLLLYGLKQSKKRPDLLRPFGYGKELYFWSFIVAIMIFGLGGGISIYQGYIHIVSPEPLTDPFWNYIVLAVSLIFEGTSFVVAVKAFNKIRGNEPWWQAIINSKDPPSFLILFEDGAAVLGLLIVFTCMFLEHRFNNPYLDGVASILVGLLLMGVSLLLARESRSLLMGEGIAKKTEDRIRKLVVEDPRIISVRYLFSTYQSPEEILLVLIITVQNDLDTTDIDEAITNARHRIKNAFPLIRFVIIQPELTD
jgi:cation diffusion facilitator family transporter